MKPRIAVGGATGNVGSELLKVLVERRFPYRQFIPLASQRSAGSSLKFDGENHVIQSLADFDFSDTDILFLSAGSDVAREIAPRAAEQGCLVIDNSSALGL